MAEALDLIPFHRDERGDERLPERLDQPLVGLERVERGAEVRGKARAGVRFVGSVGVADDGLGWSEAPVDAVEPRSEQRGRDQVGTGRPVTGANLDVTACIDGTCTAVRSP